ncbi:hypothetical protein MES4922_640004 [Mesorhizobium ventifaucium]|uniref:Uncharacterized protein n=1 Tax=Mesorhizobium ventifaucium TaxID=666020 RepID=A0ABM9EF51_9HYPH|nr:hypothetical protein MES4922_640004 [Mesorhizobium ventifaucium]
MARNAQYIAPSSFLSCLDVPARRACSSSRMVRTGVSRLLKSCTMDERHRGGTAAEKGATGSSSLRSLECEDVYRTLLSVKAVQGYSSLPNVVTQWEVRSLLF